eukprot:826479-Prymnesium_polylepis.1
MRTGSTEVSNDAGQIEKNALSRCQLGDGLRAHDAGRNSLFCMMLCSAATLHLAVDATISASNRVALPVPCLLYTSDAADDM